MKTCKHCKTEIKYNATLQRDEHVDTNYDGCGPGYPGKRAER